jgi:hypothetical protein
MAKIVAGIATAHSPHVSTLPEEWELHAERDRHNPDIDFARLTGVVRPEIEAQLKPEIYRQKHDRCNRAIDILSETLHEADPDVLVVVGDDQHEMFLNDCIPAFAVYGGHEIMDIPEDPQTLDPSIRAADWARHVLGGEAVPCCADLGRHLTAELSRAEFDVAQLTRQGEGRGLGHAFTFIRIRLMRERLIPMVPVFVNCFYPPNQPSPARCYAFGRALGRAIESWDSPKRVAIAASGGLSHFVIDEAFDRTLIDGLISKRADVLTHLPVEKLVSGTSEIRNWIIAAAALEAFDVELVDYTAAYRSTAGTGCGMGFARWSAPRELARS